MKKLCFILVVCLCLGCLTACADSSSPAANSSTAPTLFTTEPTTVPTTAPDPVPEIDYEDPNWFANGVTMIDLDPDFSYLYMAQDVSSRESIISGAENYLDTLFTDSNVTDVAFCIYQQISIVDSETMDWVYRNVAETLAENKITYYDNTVRTPSMLWYFADLYKALTEYEMDWASVCIDLCKEAGVRPWIYFRMNDLHFNNAERSPYHDSFWYEARENGWLIDNKVYGKPLGFSGYVQYAYNFAHEKVRQWMLDYIEEMVLRYDAFGFELDFMRNIYCFDYLNETGYQEYMNDFMRKVDAIIQKGEEKHGHDIKLLVRLSHTVEDNYVYGFDVATWVEEGLVDALAPSCEEVINSNIDVAQWREVVGENVGLFIGFDDHIIRLTDPRATKCYDVRVPQLKGFYASYIARGANGCYLNNYFRDQGAKSKALNSETASEGLRTFMVTYQDNTPIGNERYNPLPVAIDGLGDAGMDFPLNIGLIREEEFVYLTVGYAFDPTLKFNDPLLMEDVTTKITLNGQAPVAVEQIAVVDTEVAGCYYYVDEDDAHSFRVSPVVLRYRFENIATDGELTVHFTENERTCFVTYIDLTVSPEELA